jgi:P-type Cu2+ transporter
MALDATATALPAGASALARADCAHCGLPVPAAQARGGARYCCAGCETVARILADSGLTGYYTLPDREARAARVTDRSYAELDDEAFWRRHVRPTGGGLAETSLYLEDLRCGACVWLLERTPRLCDGVASVRVDLGRGKADVVFDPAATPLSAVARTLDRLGHPVHPYRGLDRDAQRRREDRALLIKLGVAGAAAGNVMLLAAALYAGAFGDMASADAQLFRWASLIVAVPALAYAATPFWRGAAAALRAGQLHLDLPIAAGIAAGLAWGTYDVVAGTGEIYFDSVGMLVFLLLAARWLQTRQHRRAASAAQIVQTLAPSWALRLDGGALHEIPIEAIVAGDLVLARAGDTIAVDGVVEDGASAIDAGLLTGEPRPVDVAVGDLVSAGTVNLAAPLRVRALAAGEDTRIGRLAARLGELSGRKPRIALLVDGLGGRFVAAVLAAAAVTFAAWAPAGVGRALEHAMALLVVTCPCALALAAPLTFGIAIGRAARRGLLVKGPDALERLATPGTLVLDKTGTVTEGRMRLVGFDGPAEARRAAAALEQGSAHPLARALVEAAGGDADGSDPVVTNVCETPGRGVTGTVDGQRVAVGSPAWIAAHATVPAAVAAAIDAAAARGETPVVVATDGRVIAVARFADPVRPDAATAIASLRAGGWRVELLSGDDPRVVTRAGAALGLAPGACRGGATPEAKLARIQDLAGRGPVVMVGDGVNDAAALAAATCGIAVHGGAEASIEAADVFLRTPGLAPVAETITGARRAVSAVRRNLWVSVVYNLAMGSLAAAGLIHPLFAAALMPASSLTVLALAAGSRAFAAPSAGATP